MKRKRKGQSDQRVSKRKKAEDTVVTKASWPLLRQYYPEVCTLRNYLAARLSKSKKRRRNLLYYGLDGRHPCSADCDAALVSLLDDTVVGSFKKDSTNDIESFDRDLTIFTQHLSGSTTTISPTQGALKQSEIVDFTLWLLFRRHHGSHKPSHLLSHGYQNHSVGPDNGNELCAVLGIPGLFSNLRNAHAQTLKSHPWTFLPSLLGTVADRIIGDMLLYCGLFQLAGSSSNLTQLSGVPLCELKPVKATQPSDPAITPINLQGHLSDKAKTSCKNDRGLSDIRFVRHRMLYARPILNGNGKPRSGLSHIHVLNRHTDTTDVAGTNHVLKYIFPRQFGLHNVFTSEVDYKESGQPFKDYTLRDDEIARSAQRHQPGRSSREENGSASNSFLPKRLRGRVLDLVTRLRKRHAKCSYVRLLEHYCPRSSTRADETGSIEHASSAAQVSAFCRAVFWRLFPTEFWDNERTRALNQKKVMRNIDTFVRLRRYESLSLHDVLQDVKISEVDWLAPQNLSKDAKLSETDFRKRQELMAELLYYVFDSLLIPLIRAHFHVTESGARRNQLFYFRHDVWQSLCEPALRSLQHSMFEPCNTAAVKSSLAKRALGVSQVRLLPKENGMRPIINLRRRVQQIQRGKLVLGRSINSILTPTFSVLNLEKSANPDILGSALFSIEDIYPRLQSFRQTLQSQGAAGKALFFAKVDVKACFDTIPQKRLMGLAKRILGADAYHIAKYSRGKLVGRHSDETPGFGAKPSWRYLTKASSTTNEFDFSGEVYRDVSKGRNRSVYVDGGAQRLESRKAILELLEEHVESNLIKLGNRFYRQKEGIPQGSIVSSLLCSYFYAEMERQMFAFLNDGHTVLLRLIDDFLVISTQQSIAERFMRIMHQGVPEFGVEVKVEKSRANFDIEIDGKAIPRLPAETDFPYCGNAIHTVTLDLRKDRERRRSSNIQDSISVEYSKLPGQMFYRKTLNALKLQMQALLLSTNYNSIRTVISNLHHTFTEVAQKSYHYIRSLPTSKQPPSKLVMRSLDDSIKLACVLMKRRKRSKKEVLPYECCISKAQARWLACTAFYRIFQRRQTKHAVLLTWLKEQLALPSVKAQKKDLEVMLSR